MSAISQHMNTVDVFLAKARNAVVAGANALRHADPTTPEAHAIEELGKAVDYVRMAVEHMRQAQIEKEGA